MHPVVSARMKTGATNDPHPAKTATRATRTADPLVTEAIQLRADLRESPSRPLDLRTRLVMQERNWTASDMTRTGQLSRDHRTLEAIAHEDARGEPRHSPNAPRARNVSSRSPDFSGVRLHADAHARAAARRLGARAFTFGEHIYTDPAQMSAAPSRDELLAHELSHVMQQRALGRRFMQPRLIASGSADDIERFITLAEAAMGEDLQHDPATGEITAVATLPNPPTSPAFAAAMHRIIDDPAQDAEAHFGTAQPRVAVGAFPQPSDLTGSREQHIDIDDVEAIEAGAPGNGLGKLAHELTENYTAHAAVPAAGVDLFAAAHQAGLSAESDVAEDTVGPGRRVADVDTPAVGNTFTRVQDFENYYLVFDLTRDPATNDFSVTNARQAARDNISITVIDHFVTGSAAIPPGNAARIAAAAADVAANPASTVRIEGFTDTVGTAVVNVILSNLRAEAGEAALRAAGVAGGRMHAVGEGQSSPVAPNTSEANRARNRRIVITVDQPAP
jgi:outer membrane protein OmpA-like peptidoglycan-associated protein/HAMP domain-containing protein